MHLPAYSTRWLILAAVTALSLHSGRGQTKPGTDGLEVTITGRQAHTVIVSERSSSSFFMRVTDAAGNEVEGITTQNVAVKKSGDNVRVTRVLPLRGTDFLAKSVVLVLDNSSSMTNREEILLRSLQRFLDTLGAGAEVAVVMFEENTEWLRTHPVKYADQDLNLAVMDFTSDYGAIMRRAQIWFESHKTNRTYLRDAALYGMSMLADIPAYMQKSLVIMSDGDDVGSTFTLDQVLDSYAGDVRIYMIDFDPADAEIETLKKIREKTGGNWYLAKEPEDLVSVFGQISRDLSLVYLVDYKSRQSVESVVLNYVFFDHNSSQLRPQYKVFADYKQTLTFDETGFSSQMDQYYNVLNVIGARMYMYPNASLTLTGCNSGYGEEQGNRDLSQQRAATVREYLTSVWHVDPARIKIEARDLPAKASTSSTEPGRAENRRVEITSSTPDVLKPVLTNKLVGEVEDRNSITEIYSLQLFDFNSSEVGSVNAAMLGDVAVTYKSVAGAKVKAVGYTDNIGDAAYNTKLAKERADNACTVMGKKGVPAGSMQSVGLGPESPQFDNGTPEGRFFNRAVRVYLTYPKM